MITGLFDWLDNHPAPDRTERQRQLIRSAVALFSEQGFSHTTTAQIAAHAGVSEAMIFKYYKTKEQLLLSLIISFMKDFSPDLSREVAEKLPPMVDTDPAQLIGWLVRDRVAFVTEHRDIFQVLVKEIVYSADLKTELLTHVTKNVAGLAANVPGGAPLAASGDDEPDYRAARSFVADFAGFLIAQFIIADQEEIAEDDVEAFVHMLTSKVRRNSSHQGSGYHNGGH